MKAKMTGRTVSDIANCNDCIHRKVCVILAFPEAFENTEWEKEPCDHFKDADVAPKSEVDKWFRECEELQGRLIENEKEVAREIFEEIYEDCFDQFGYIDYEKFAELKKKYTEGKER